ncbi:MAG: hypothetical protein RLZZ316_2353, partial [Bacteroidota bacterium]
MLYKLNRQKAIDDFPILPLRYYDKKKDDYIFKNPKVFANYVLAVLAKSKKGYIKLMTTELIKLIEVGGGDKLIFLGDLDIPWLKRLNTHASFQEPLQYLIDNKIGKRFNGAIQVSIKELPVFIKHLTRLVSSNGILPYVHFTDPKQSFLGDFCQYDDLHLSTMNKPVDKLFQQFICTSKFELLNKEA